MKASGVELTDEEDSLQVHFGVDGGSRKVQRPS